MAVFTQAQRTIQIFRKMWRYLRLSDFEGASYRDLKRRFTRELIQHLNLKVIQKNSSANTQLHPAIYVCNHISYLDIPLVMNQIPEACFVSKSEVANWPIIGLAAKRIETVFVKRESKTSREGVRKALTQSLAEEKKKIIVFPSATTKIFKAEKWRKGVFEIAHELNVPVVPVRLHYTPLREVAYIDDDNFILHLFRLVKYKNLQVEIEFGEPVHVQKPVEDCLRIKEWCEEKMAHA